jgi:uncharacterized protein YnzC (UPF0291/DUF896 family)
VHNIAAFKYFFWDKSKSSELHYEEIKEQIKFRESLIPPAQIILSFVSRVATLKYGV